MKLSEIKNSIQPLDILVINGKEIYAKAISFAELFFLGNGQWTHVGVVLNSDVISFEGIEKDKLYIFESTLSSEEYPDRKTGKKKFGVQIRDLEDVLNECIDHENILVLRKLANNPLDSEDAEKVKESIQKFFDATIDKSYDWLSLPRALFSCFCNICPRKKSYFCTELAVELYQEVGLIDKDFDPETISPPELMDDPWNIFSDQITYIDAL